MCKNERKRVKVSIFVFLKGNQNINRYVTD